ncbi:MAG: carbohydrate ABC transporter permease [Tissierellia bacterium]|nr:carbohydrate ABC transporter permease [Tissierellia bacterium]
MSIIRRGSAAILRHGLLIILCFTAFFPLFWMISSSFKNMGEILGAGLFPSQITLENYIYAFQEMPIAKMMSNSFFIAIAMSFFQLVIAVLTAYALTRWDFPGKRIFYALLTLTWLIPFQAIMIPNYIEINNMGLRGSLIAIILPYMASAFCCISMYQAFQSFPRALLDAARMDGASELQILMDIILPNMKSTIASLGILQFITGWNEYMWPMLVTTGLDSAPIQMGLRSFVSSDANMWGSLMAAATVSSIPILIIYMVLQKNIVNSFMKWGIK